MDSNVLKYSFFLSIAVFILFLSTQAQNLRGVTGQLEVVNSEQQGKYHAIIISQNQYEDPRLNDLDKPRTDADKLEKLLTTKYFFNSSDIIRLVDPVRSDIYKAVETKTKTLTPDDQLLIFYAGHGQWDSILKMGYWIPADATIDNKANWLSNTDLSIYLAAIQARHILLISDACFGGSIFKMRSIGQMDQGIQRLYSLKSRKALTSGNLKEVPDESVFLKYFIRELEENSQMFITTDQIFSRIRPNILNNSETEPLYGVVYGTGDDGGEFVFYNVNDSASKSLSSSTQARQSIRSTERTAPVDILHHENRMLEKPKRVAFINFDNSTGKIGEYGDLGGALRDMLVSDLRDVKNLEVVDRQALEKVLQEQKLGNSSNFDPSTALRIGKLLGAEMIMTGTYFEFYGSLRIDAKFINVETGRVDFSVGVDGQREKLFELKNVLANRVVEKLRG